MARVKPKTRERIIVGISGATGIAYGAAIMRRLRELGIEIHLVVSRTGDITRATETDLTAEALRGMADVVHGINDMTASISSGSFKTRGMVIAPCSMRSLAEVASGVTTSLLTRAADVVLKERRRLVLLTRETPLHLGHLRNMVAVTEMGGVVMPPLPAFYNRPKSIEELIDDTACRTLDLFGLDVPDAKRWGEDGKGEPDI